MVLLIGDLTSVGDEDAELYQKKLSSIIDKKIIIPQKNEEDPFKLDFFWFDSRLNDILGLQVKE